MSKKYIIILLLILCTLNNILNAQNFTWAKQMGGLANVLPRTIAVDAGGNVLTTGRFTGTCDFDPGAGTYNLTAIDVNYPETFISKIENSGNFLWAKQFGGSLAVSNGYGIAVDAGGNVYATGYFTDTIDFDPGPGTYNMVGPGSFGCSFVLKLDPSGNFLWAKQFVTTNACYGTAIKVDANNNVYSNGTFSGLTDFDPGPGIYNISPSGGDAYISKLDSSGNFIWAKKLAGNDNSEGDAIALDADANVYTTGSFAGTTDFDPGPGTYNLTTIPAGVSDMYVWKLDSSGNFLWGKQMAGTQTQTSMSVAADMNGNVCTTGWFYGTVDFDPGPATYNVTAGTSYGSIFISKLDSAGSFVFAKTIGGSINNPDAKGYSVAPDAAGNVYTTGYFQGNIDFDPGPATYYMNNTNGHDAYLSILDPIGNFLAAKQFPGKDNNEAYSLAVDAGNNIYITGSFIDTVDFDPGTGTYNMISHNNGNSNDLFVVKFSNSTGVDENHTKDNFSVYPNPGNGTISLSGSKKIDELKIYNPEGRIVYQVKPDSNDYLFRLEMPGIYFIRITLGKETVIKKLIVF